MSDETMPPAITPSIQAGPTTANGPLAHAEPTAADRLVTAQFADPAAAAAVRDALVAQGVAPDAIQIIAHAADHAGVRTETRPADNTLQGRLRELLAPDDVAAGARQAVRDDTAVLNVVPAADQLDLILRVIAAGSPVRFDAALERWRNQG